MADTTEHDDSPTGAPAEEPTDVAAEEAAIGTPQSAEMPADQVTAAPDGTAPHEDGNDADDVAAAVAAASENVAAVTGAEERAEAEPEADTEAEAAAHVIADSPDAGETDTDTEAAAESALDDIAPGTTGPEPVAPTPEPADGRSANKVSLWPFVIYDMLWMVFAGLMVWQFEALPDGAPVYEAELYPVAVMVGLILLIAGPLLIFVSWVAAWGRPGSSKGRLLISALVRGSVATLIGVGIWWIALLVLDQIRLGKLL